MGFFLQLTLKLARELAALPEAHQVHRISRWQQPGLDYPFEASLMRTFFLITAFAHSEDLADQELRTGNA